jgi:hypothetical protein
MGHQPRAAARAGGIPLHFGAWAIGFLKLHEAAGRRLKIYSITVAGGPPRPELVTVGEALVSSVMPAPAVHSGTDDPRNASTVRRRGSHPPACGRCRNSCATA